MSYLRSIGCEFASGPYCGAPIAEYDVSRVIAVVRKTEEKYKAARAFQNEVQGQEEGGCSNGSVTRWAPAGSSFRAAASGCTAPRVRASPRQSRNAAGASSASRKKRKSQGCGDGAGRGADGCAAAAERRATGVARGAAAVPTGSSSSRRCGRAAEHAADDFAHRRRIADSRGQRPGRGRGGKSLACLADARGAARRGPQVNGQAGAPPPMPPPQQPAGAPVPPQGAAYAGGPDLSTLPPSIAESLARLAGTLPRRPAKPETSGA